MVWVLPVWAVGQAGSYCLRISGFATFGFPVVRVFRLDSVVPVFLLLLLNPSFAFCSFFFTVCHVASLILV